MFEEQYLEEKRTPKDRSNQDTMKDAAKPHDSYTPCDINAIFDKNYFPISLQTIEKLSQITREMHLRKIGGTLLIPLIFEIFAVALIPEVNPLCYVLILVTGILAGILLFASHRSSESPPS